MTNSYSVYLRKANADDCKTLQQAFINSESLHRPWSYPPQSYEDYILAPHLYLACLKQGQHIAGAFNITGVVRGFFQSAYLGYHAFTPYANKGYMSQAIQLLVEEAFTTLNLHRLEANIQPENYASKALVQKAGFQCEGFSPHYLKVGGMEWAGHERWAIINHRWQAEN